MSLRGGRYERLRPIASGGMATVYLGRAHGMGVGGFERPVAIKVMHPHLADTDEFVTMFLDEARIAAQIRHPNVVATLDAVRDDEGLFLVMEYVDGLSVHHLFKATSKENKTVPIEISLRIMHDALLGLHAAHELKGNDESALNVVHRDVSPQNILVGTEGVAQITDFGIARAESRSAAATRTGQVKGKIAYMSIEQIRSDDVDRRSDIYAAGVVLWELLTGRRLFKASNEGAIALQAADGAKESPRDVNPAVPAPISDCVMQALAISTEDRFQNARAFAEAIDDAAHQSGLRLAKTSAVGEFVKLTAREAADGSSATGPSAADLGAAAHRVVGGLGVQMKPASADGAEVPQAFPNTSATQTASVITPPPALRKPQLHLWGAAAGSTVIGIGLAVVLFSLEGGDPESSKDGAATTDGATEPPDSAATTPGSPKPDVTTTEPENAKPVVDTPDDDTPDDDASKVDAPDVIAPDVDKAAADVSGSSTQAPTGLNKTAPSTAPHPKATSKPVLPKPNLPKPQGPTDGNTPFRPKKL